MPSNNLIGPIKLFVSSSLIVSRTSVFFGAIFLVQSIQEFKLPQEFLLASILNQLPNSKTRPIFGKSV